MSSLKLSLMSQRPKAKNRTILLKGLSVSKIKGGHQVKMSLKRGAGMDRAFEAEALAGEQLFAAARPLGLDRNPADAEKALKVKLAP